MELNFNVVISMKNSFFPSPFTSVFHLSTGDSSFDLVWTSGADGERDVGNQRKADRDGRDREISFIH